ncbi:sec-independent protein translocase protein TATB, chloroplastic-like [Gossypium australe]|uniref:Sec-independent protein translocase protein TATB, chloroplastic-like n=1 Tax=Gossypium australe TaxID=47621 RepID=A0A5B6UFX8_9ROSI|nr:sec-independent protein translocase protein TATB, chloroplastic-like [Gossypium australe]
MTTIMAVSTSAFLFTPSVSSKSTIFSFSPLVLHRKSFPFRFSTWFPQLGPSFFSQWSGLKHLGISISPKSLKLEKKGRCKGKVVHASLFGVGAPEALVIGVVALLVFGPKGLAEVARNLGKTLRAFQPTIRELQEVSREFKSTLEREIGLDEMPSSTQNTLNRNSPYLSNAPLTPSPVTSAEETGSDADPGKRFIFLYFGLISGMKLSYKIFPLNLTYVVMIAYPETCTKWYCIAFDPAFYGLVVGTFLIPYPIPLVYSNEI